MEFFSTIFSGETTICPNPFQRVFAMAAMVIQAEQELQSSRRQRVLQESKMRSADAGEERVISWGLVGGRMVI